MTFYFHRIQTAVGGGQNVEHRNVERMIFRNFKTANNKITKDELFDSFVANLIFNISEIIWSLEIFNTFLSCEILIFQMVELIFVFSKLEIFEIGNFWVRYKLSNDRM